MKIEQKQFTYKDFGDYLLKTQRSSQVKGSLKVMVLKKYEDFLNSNLVTYKKENLENENEEFAHILGEYRDGLLLFDLMESTIWNASKTDSIGIKEYYESHKNQYICASAY